MKKTQRQFWNPAYGEFRPKNSFFWTLKPSHKKKYHPNPKKWAWNQKSFKKSGKKISWNHFGFTKTDHFSNYQLKSSFSDLHYRVKKSLAISLTDSKVVNISLRSWNGPANERKTRSHPKIVMLRVTKRFKKVPKPRFFC